MDDSTTFQSGMRSSQCVTSHVSHALYVSHSDNQFFRGSELQNYFTKILEDKLRAIIKPQYVDSIPRAVKGTVIAVLERKAEEDGQSIEVCA